METKYDDFRFILISLNNKFELLYPDDLFNKNIIPSTEGYDIVYSQCFFGPGFTKITYDGGIVIVSSENKYIFNDKIPNGDLFPLPEILNKFITSKSYLNYDKFLIGIGKYVRFDSIDKIKEFLNKIGNKLIELDNNLCNNLSFDFIYNESNANLNIQGIGRKLPNSKNEEYGLLFETNFDINIKKSRKTGNIAKILEEIEQYKKYEMKVDSIINKFIGE